MVCSYLTFIMHINCAPFVIPINIGTFVRLCVILGVTLWLNFFLTTIRFETSKTVNNQNYNINDYQC